jgi:phosphoglycerate dehydrogenase-like enzyme
VTGSAAQNHSPLFVVFRDATERSRVADVREPVMKAVRTDGELECPRIDAGLQARGVELVTLPDRVTEAELAREVADADLLLMCYTPVTPQVIESAPRLKGIVKYGVGIDAIDIVAARRRGIPVVNVPDYAEETVAEGAFALLISLVKRLPAITGAVAREGWIWPQQRWLGQDIAGKTLGLVGVGRIGRSMARMAGQGSERVLWVLILTSMRPPCAPLAWKRSTISKQCWPHLTSSPSIAC